MQLTYKVFMKKYIIFLACITMLFILSSCSANKEAKVDVADKFIKEKADTPVVAEDFKIKKDDEFLSCLKPYAIDGINKIYLRNKKDQIVYTIEILGSEGECKWKVDTLYFHNDLSLKKANKIKKDFKPNLYLDETFYMNFKVKKIRAKENLDIKSIVIPYFIVLNNKASNKILKQLSFNIKIDLSKPGEQIITSEKISLKENFLTGDFMNIELMSGIYFNKVPKF